MSAPYRPDFVLVIDRTARLHGRCPHCREAVAVEAPRSNDVCASCQQAFALADILPVTRIALR